MIDGGGDREGTFAVDAGRACQITFRSDGENAVGLEPVAA